MFFTKEFHIVPNHYTVVSKIQANECTILMTIFIVHLLMDKQLNVLTPMNFFPSDHVHVHSLATHLYYYYKYINISICYFYYLLCVNKCQIWKTSSS